MNQIDSPINFLNYLQQAVSKASDFLSKLGRSDQIRNNLGTEFLFRWRVMLQLELNLDPKFFQSPEVKLGLPIAKEHFKPINQEYTSQPSFDLGILEKETWNPYLIAEFKFTGYKQLKKHVMNDFVRLLDVDNYRKYQEHPIPCYLGLVFFMEYIKKYQTSEYISILQDKFLAQHFLPEIWQKSTSSLKNRYFELIVIEGITQPFQIIFHLNPGIKEILQSSDF